MKCFLSKHQAQLQLIFLEGQCINAHYFLAQFSSLCQVSSSLGSICPDHAGCRRNRVGLEYLITV
uniref:Uncharacterized protein n=1 Tax=Oryza brachyantha TaxID=4533 RepID=J3LW32_ORYBR